MASVITVHGLGGLSRTAWVVDWTISFDTVAGPGLVSSTGVSTGRAPATPLTPDILIILLYNIQTQLSSTFSPLVQVSVHSLDRVWSQELSEQGPQGVQGSQVPRMIYLTPQLYSWHQGVTPPTTCSLRQCKAWQGNNTYRLYLSAFRWKV